MMLGFIPLSFRFRGKVNQLLDMYQCFVDHPNQALHPNQVARHARLGLHEVNARLQQTPELFVKLPRRPDGLTRYRLTSRTSTLSAEEVEALVVSGARRESWLLYATATLVIGLLLIVALLAALAV